MKVIIYLNLLYLSPTSYIESFYFSIITSPGRGRQQVSRLDSKCLIQGTRKSY